MKKRPEQNEGSKMRAEYDFSHGVRGKHARRYAQGANVIVIEPDLAKVFPNAAAVNDTLRAVAGIIRGRHKTQAITT